MKCLLNYFAMNRQSGERKRRCREREEGVEKREKGIEAAVASTVGGRMRDATVTAVIEKSTGWDTVKHWHWYGIWDKGYRTWEWEWEWAWQ